MCLYVRRGVCVCVCVCVCAYMETLRPINIKRARQLTRTTLFSLKRKKLPGWDSNPRHTAC